MGCLVCIEMDANAKLGCDIIPGDPHPLSSNGQFLKNIIDMNDLIICNADPNCSGLFTRERETVNGKEKSIIDFFIVCQDMFCLFKNMKIDALNAFTKYEKRKIKSV